MRQLTAGLALMALAVTGCAAATTSSGTATSHRATTATGTSGTATAGTAGTGHSGPVGGGGSGLAQWVVDGTFETKGGGAQPLAGVVTFRNSTTGRSVNVTVGASGKFSLGLPAGTYTATGQTGQGGPPCSGPVTVTVHAGQLTRVSLACQAS
jgi:hypothetical protein